MSLVISQAYLLDVFLTGDNISKAAACLYVREIDQFQSWKDNVHSLQKQMEVKLKFRQTGNSNSNKSAQTHTRLRNIFHATRMWQKQKREELGSIVISSFILITARTLCTNLHTKLLCSRRAEEKKIAGRDVWTLQVLIEGIRLGLLIKID